MVYQFTVPGLFPVTAQAAGEELHRIYTERGELDPKRVVEESRAESAPLHPCFEWDDKSAAEKYRESQAQDIIRAVVVVQQKQNGEPVTVRAFPHVQQTYQPISVVVNSQDKMDELLKTAMRELISFRRKYETLSALRPVFDTIEKLTD